MIEKGQGWSHMAGLWIENLAFGLLWRLPPPPPPPPPPPSHLNHSHNHNHNLALRTSSPPSSLNSLDENWKYLSWTLSWTFKQGARGYEGMY
jgi:hypothetical protein